MKSLSIKYQFLLVALIPVLLIDIFLTVNNINNSIAQAENLLQSKGEIIARQIAGASEFNLFSGNYDQIQYLLDQSIDTNDIIYAAVYDANGSPIARSVGKTYASEKTAQYFYYRQPIQSETLEFGDVFAPNVDSEQPVMRNLGWVHLNISKQRLESNKSQIYLDGAIFFVTMLVIAVVLTLFISKRITRPIFKLLDHLKQIETGHLGQVIEDIEGNEIGEVQKGFNSMSQSLLANRMQLDQKIKSATLELMNAITDLEYKNRELAVARDAAQNADQIKSQFLANISHEIRTPINGIKGFVNLLSKTGLLPEQQRYAEIISQSTDDLTVMVNEVLHFSKLESGNFRIDPRAFDLFELLETTRDSLFSTALEKQIDLFLIIYSDIPKIVIGDELRIKQILINLLSNAIKFTDKGFVSITVIVEDESDDQLMLRFDIQDSGIGIAEQDQKILFQAFRQIESDANRRFSGTGLGLVISRNLAALMGGDIQLKSALGDGSLFSLRLPFKPVSQVGLEKSKGHSALIVAANTFCLRESQSLFGRIGLDIETLLLERTDQIEDISGQIQQSLKYVDFLVIDCRQLPVTIDALVDTTMLDQCRIILVHYDISLLDPQSTNRYEFVSLINTSQRLQQQLFDTGQSEESVTDNQPAPGIEPTVKRKCVLVVDDNPVNLMLAGELISLWGHDSVRAANAQEALQSFDNQQFDLILLDIQMPEIDGLQLMKMIRQQHPDLTTPIVALTANIMPEDEQRLISEGFDGYVSKPIDEERLSAWLNRSEPMIGKTLKERSEETDDEELTIDFALTLKLSAHKPELMREILDLLALEVPHYHREISQFLETHDRVELGKILHKLEGVTCYTGLPKLKRLLRDYDEAKLVSSDTVYKTCESILLELEQIGVQLEEFQNNEEIPGVKSS